MTERIIKCDQCKNIIWAKQIDIPVVLVPGAISANIVLFGKPDQSQLVIFCNHGCFAEWAEKNPYSNVN